MSQIVMRKLSTDPCNSMFDCGVKGINNMIKRSYYSTLLQQLYCYEIVVDGIVIGYYMLGFRKIKFEECPGDIGDLFDDLSEDGYCALHIKYIAITAKYQKRGIGTKVLYILLRQIKELCKTWPVRIITLDAIRERVEWYKKNGFLLFNEEDINKGCKEIPMYMDFILEPEKVKDYISQNP